MSHMIELSDEAYKMLLQAALRRGQTPEALLKSLITEADARDSHVYDDLDEFFRALGMTEAEIAESERIFNEREQADAGQGRSQLEAVEDADV